MAKVAKRRDRYVLDFYDNQGKRRRQALPLGTTKKRAREILRGIEEQVSQGAYLPDKRIPTFQDVGQDWLEYKKDNIRASTWQTYDGHLRNHFENIDPVKINRIKLKTVEQFITDKRQESISLETVRKLIKTFNQVMKYAVRHDYISHNPVTDAERPRGHGAVEPPKMKIINPEQINALVEATKKPKYKMLFLLAAMSGARQGELLGLKWSDVDWEKNQVHIQRTYNKGAWYKPKSAASYQKMYLGKIVIRKLKEWKLACPASDLDLIFPNEAGGPIGQSNMLHRHFYPAFKAAEVPRIRFHDLRHSYASLLIDQGENIKYIQTQLGHAKASMTLDVYGHLINPTNPESASKLEEKFFGRTGHNLVTKQKKGINHFS